MYNIQIKCLKLILRKKNSYSLLTFGDETQDRIGLVERWIFMADVSVVSSQKGPVEVHHVERISIGVSAMTRLTSAALARCSHSIPERLVESRKRRRGVHQTDPQRENCAQDPADKPPHVKSRL